MMKLFQLDGSTSTSESFKSAVPSMTIRQRIHEIENIAPITTFFRYFLDPVIVVIALYVLHFAFDVVFDGLHIILAVMAFLLSMQFLDGTYLFLPGEKKAMVGFRSFCIFWLFIIFVLVLVGAVSHFRSLLLPSIYSYVVCCFPTFTDFNPSYNPKNDHARREKTIKIVNTAIVGANQAGLSLQKYRKQIPKHDFCRLL